MMPRLVSIAMTCLALIGAGAKQVNAQEKPRPASSATPRDARPIAPARSDTQPATRASEVDPAEAAPYVTEIKVLHDQLVARSTWADLGDRCNPGALRVFAKDTTADGMANIDRMLQRMQDIIVVMGAGKTVDDADGRLLVRTIMEWEAGLDRPYWDAPGATPKLAFAAGLTGDYPDPQSNKCFNAPRSSDTVTVVVPAVTVIDVRSPSSIKLKAYIGAGAVNHARDEFFAAHRSEPGASLEYLQLAPVVRWNEWAVVKVTRPVEEGGVELGKGGKGGAVYLMRRDNSQWRLFAVAQSWGR